MVNMKYFYKILAMAFLFFNTIGAYADHTCNGDNINFYVYNQTNMTLTMAPIFTNELGRGKDWAGARDQKDFIENMGLVNILPGKNFSSFTGVCSNQQDNSMGFSFGPYTIIYQHGYAKAKTNIPDWLNTGLLGNYTVFSMAWGDRPYLRWVILGPKNSVTAAWGENCGQDICVKTDVKNCVGSYCNVTAQIWINAVPSGMPMAPRGKA